MVDDRMPAFDAIPAPGGAGLGGILQEYAGAGVLVTGSVITVGEARLLLGRGNR